MDGAGGRDKTFLRRLLSKQVHFTVTDGRVFKGQFMCTDSEGSAILHETYEHRGGKFCPS